MGFLNMCKRSFFSFLSALIGERQQRSSLADARQGVVLELFQNPFTAELRLQYNMAL